MMAYHGASSEIALRLREFRGGTSRRYGTSARYMYNGVTTNIQTLDVITESILVKVAYIIDRC